MPAHSIRSSFKRCAAAACLSLGLALPSQAADIPADRDQYGGAALVSADVSFYAGYRNLPQQLLRLWQSPAMVNLRASELGQELTQAIMDNPDTTEGLMTLMSHPLVVDLMPLLGAELGPDIFLTAPASMPSDIAALQDLAMQMQVAAAQIQRSPWQQEAIIVDSMVQYMNSLEAPLRLPSMLMGVRVHDAAATAKVLEKWLPKTPMPWQQQGTSWQLRLSGADLPWDSIDGKLSEAVAQGVDEAQLERAKNQIKAATLAVDVVLRDGYLLVNAGPDNSALSLLNAENGLAQSDHFSALRAHNPGNLLGVAYVHKSMEPIAWTRKNYTQNWLGQMITAIPDPTPNQMISSNLWNLYDDFFTALDEFDGDYPNTLTFTTYDQGIHSWTYETFATPPTEAMAPMAILQHRGNKALLSTAGMMRADLASYDFAATWTIKTYDMIDGLVRQIAPPPAVEPWEIIGRALRANGFKFDLAVRNQLIPSLADSQALITIDMAGSLQEFDSSSFDPAIPVPRMAIACSVADVAIFRQAVMSIGSAIDGFLRDISTEPSLGMGEELRVPLPESDSANGVERLRYTFEHELGAVLDPVVLMNQNMVVFATTETQAREVLTSIAAPQPAGVAVNDPAVDVMVADMGALLNSICNSADAMISNAIAQTSHEADIKDYENMRRKMKDLQSIAQHIGHFQSRIYWQGKQRITHEVLNLKP